MIYTNKNGNKEELSKKNRSAQKKSQNIWNFQLYFLLRQAAKAERVSLHRNTPLSLLSHTSGVVFFYRVSAGMPFSVFTHAKTLGH
jgi:hypothetical protein